MKKSKILLVLILILAATLRIWQLDSVPVSLFGDELDAGYQAYSVLKTGKDYSGNLLPIHFRSLGEWRTPLYIYSAIPTVAIFGISPLGVRLPAAIFGILGILAIFLLINQLTQNKAISLLSAFFLSISPWHIQYSRAGFEVTLMLFLYILGIYFFIKGLNNGRLFSFSSLCLGLTPWVYSTAKLFLPLTIISLLFIWWKDIKKISKFRLLISVIIFISVVGPFTVNTIVGGGIQRIGDISIFNDPTIIPTIGFERLNDAKMQDSNAQFGSKATLVDKLFHNQPLTFSGIFFKNYLQSFSTNFLFIQGDINLRHSAGSGEFYKIEAVLLILGLILFINSSIRWRIKFFIFFWILAAPIPSALTKDGGSHATRLIFMLPPLIFLISFGAYYSYLKLNKRFKIISIAFVFFILISFLLYQHDYWAHYPWRSERWWHAGYEDAIKSAVNESVNYKSVIISSANEPSLIFFLAWSMYPPDHFLDEYNLYLSNRENTNSTLKLGKYEFPPVGQGISLYEMGSKLPERVLYMATAKEIVFDLNKEPERLPGDIKLVKIINYPSGYPAFYLFTKP